MPPTTTSADTPCFSLIVPCYNEQSRILATLRGLLPTLEKSHDVFELIVVDDGSTDGTRAVVQQAIDAGEVRYTRVIGYPQNRGKGYAVRFGFENARGDYLLFTDADLAYAPEDILLLLQSLETRKFPVVIGSRELAETDIEEAPPFYRVIMGRIYNLLIRTLTNLTIADTQCGLKGFHRSAFQAIDRDLTIDHFAFDVEWLFLAKKRGFVIHEIPVHLNHWDHRSRIHFIADTWKMFTALLKIGIRNRLGRYEHTLDHQRG